MKFPERFHKCSRHARLHRIHRRGAPRVPLLPPVGDVDEGKRPEGVDQRAGGAEGGLVAGEEDVGAIVDLEGWTCEQWSYIMRKRTTI